MKREFTVENGGATIHGEEAGTGPVLLRLHAGGADTRMRHDQMTGLGDIFRAPRNSAVFSSIRISDARGHEILDCAHLPNYEQPEVVNRVMREFYESVG